MLSVIEDHQNKETDLSLTLQYEFNMMTWYYPHVILKICSIRFISFSDSLKQGGMLVLVSMACFGMDNL